MSGTQVFKKSFCDVNRHSEADSDVAAGSVYRRVDANDVALRVEKRSTTVAWIDGGIGLDHVFEFIAVLVLDGPPKRADDARRQAAVQAEGITNGKHFLADLNWIGIAKTDKRELPLGVDLQQCQIA